MKNRKHLKKCVACALLAIAMLLPLSLPAYANSAQTRWHGVDATGAMVVGEACPIEVQREVLTLDIAEFPSNYYESLADYLAYTGRVTAAYTFYNPTELTVTATLVFPFGTQPSYADLYDEESGTYLTAADTEKYSITVNGEAVEKRIRYTVNYSLQFDLQKGLADLQEGYAADTFFAPNTRVTKYTYVVGGADKACPIDEGKYPAATVAFDWDGGDGSARLYFPAFTTFHTQKDGDGRFGLSAENGTEFSLYVIGQPLQDLLSFTCYEDGGTEDGEEIAGGVTLTGTSECTFEELVLTQWSEETGVSRVDWYNASLALFREGINANTHYNFVYADFDILASAERFLSGLMRWYEYDITLPPKATLENCVTAPFYPAIDTGYIPPVCTYTYLLSPASTWARFGALEIGVNTPYYITESSLAGFVKTEDGYRLVREGLPQGELVLALSASENPQKPPRTLTSYIPFEMILTLSIFAGAVLLVGGGITAFILIRRRKKQ